MLLTSNLIGALFIIPFCILEPIRAKWNRSAGSIFCQDQGFRRRAYLLVRSRRKPQIMAENDSALRVG